MLPPWLVPGSLPMHHTILGAGLLEKGTITQRLCTGWVVWRTHSTGGLLSSGFTLKFWDDKWRVRKDWLWGGQTMGCWGSAQWPVTEVTVSAVTQESGERLMPGLLFGFPVSQKRMEGFSRHNQEWLDHCGPLCRVGSSGEELGGSSPFSGRTSAWPSASHCLCHSSHQEQKMSPSSCLLHCTLPKHSVTFVCLIGKA